MKIVIKETGIKLKKELKEFVKKEINSLEKFGKDIFKDFDVEAWVEVGKITKHHKKGPFFYAECQMRFPGRSIRSEALKKNLKSAIIEVRKDSEREIKKYKEKFVAKIKRGQRAFKKDLKLSPSARFYRKGRVRQEGR